MTILLKEKAILILLLFFFLVSCSTDAPEIPVPPGVKAGIYQLRPNTFWAGDSIEKYLSHGVVMVGQPGAQYELSFVQDKSVVAPKLRLYRLFPHEDRLRYVNEQLLKAEIRDNRYVYEFSPQGSAQVFWLTVLEDEGERWEGIVKGLHYEGHGANSDSLNVNLWFAGEFNGFAQNMGVQDLAQQLKSDLLKYYTPVGFKIGDIRVLQAHEHPQYGHLFPSQEKVVVEDFENRFDSLNFGFDATYYRAIDLLMVHSFQKYGVLGLSPLYGFNIREGMGGVILLATHGPGMMGIEKMTVAEISKTAMHEMGHFFGLRHTTTTARDLLAYLDASLYEDGLSDTPWCPGLEDLSQVDISMSFAYTALRKVANFPDYCPDFKNLMFPYAYEGEAEQFSTQQGEIMLKNLRLYP